MRAAKPVEAAAPKTLQDTMNYVTTLQELAGRLVAQLDAIKLPSGGREPFDRFVSISKQQLDALGRMRDDLTSRNLAQLRQDGAAFDQLTAGSDTAARQYGLADCVSPGHQTSE